MPAHRWDLLLTHATLATLDGETPFGLVENAALAEKLVISNWDGYMPKDMAEKFKAA